MRNSSVSWSVTEALRLGALLFVFALVGCAGGAGGSGGSFPYEDASAPVDSACVANMTVSCPCAGSAQMGTQTCNAQGTGFTGPCVGCPSTSCSCAGRSCGPDSCGGGGATACGACGSTEMCRADGACVPRPPTCNCAGRACGPDSCGGGGATACGSCPSGYTCSASGSCDPPPCTCTGRACGPDSCGAGGSTRCGSCPSGYSCNSNGACVPPSCSCTGRVCGPDSCGAGGSARCGSCAAGYTCNSSGTACNPIPPTCSVAPGGTCVVDSDCCPQAAYPSVRMRCARLTGWGTICTASCSTNSGCNSGCCGSLTDGTSVCSAPPFCDRRSSCYITLPSSTACRSDADCCPETSGLRNPTACACSGSACTCRALCSRNSDCSSNCCMRRTDGILVCGAAGSGTCL